MAKKKPVRRKPRRSRIEREETQARMLEDFARLSGISFADIIASQFEEPAEFEERELDEEDTVEDDLDLSNEYSGDTDEFIDSLADDISVDLDSNKDSDGSIEPEDFARARRRLKRKVGAKKYRAIRRKEKRAYRAKQKARRVYRG